MSQINGDRMVNAKRLLDAADVLLEAEAANAQGMGLVEVRKRDTSHSRCDQFTAEELVEAMCFLIRAGLVQPRDTGCGCVKPPHRC